MASGETQASVASGRFGTWRLPLASIVFVCLIACASLANAEAIAVREEFKNNDFDRDKWKVDKVDVKSGRVEVIEDSLHYNVLPGPVRPKFGVNSKFPVEGDFEASMDFRVDEFPTPEAEFVNTEIIVSNKDGMAYFSRTNHKGAGQGYLLYFAPSKESGKKSLWKHEPATDLKGTMRVKRVGDQMTFTYLPDGETIANKVATVSFGPDKVDKVTYSVNVAGPIDRGFNVYLDNLEVKNPGAVVATPVAAGTPAAAATTTAATATTTEAPRSTSWSGFLMGFVVATVVVGIAAMVILKMKS